MALRFFVHISFAFVRFFASTLAAAIWLTHLTGEYFYRFFDEPRVIG